MKIYFEQITADGIDINTAFEFEDLSSHIIVESFVGKIYPIKKAFFLDGKVVFTIKDQCDRCLEIFQNKFFERIQIEIVRNEPSEYEKNEEIELNEEDLSYYSVNDDFIDINKIIKEEVILLKPMKWLCKEDCKGLCSHCGTNLNEEKCKCEKTEIDSRFKILKKLKNV